MKLPRRIKLDIDQEYYNLIPAQQGDTARVLNFQILNNGIPFSLENKTVRARIKKPDGNVCYNDMEIINASEGECDLKLTNQILIKPGMCKVQLEIMENGEILSTIIFAIFIRESIDIKDAAESTNEFTALENGIIKLDEWDKYFKETSGAIEEKYTERLNRINSSLEETKNEVDGLSTNKVDKETGKGLSTNDYTSTEKAEVAKIKDKATKEEVNALDERVNNIISNNQDTSNNTELLDIRNGGDGINYSAAGEAVREQFKKAVSQSQHVNAIAYLADNAIFSYTDDLSPTLHFEGGLNIKYGKSNNSNLVITLNEIFEKATSFGFTVDVENKNISGVTDFSMIIEGDTEILKFVKLNEVKAKDIVLFCNWYMYKGGLLTELGDRHALKALKKSTEKVTNYSFKVGKRANASVYVNEGGDVLITKELQPTVTFADSIVVRNYDENRQIVFTVQEILESATQAGFTVDASKNSFKGDYSFALVVDGDTNKLKINKPSVNIKSSDIPLLYHHYSSINGGLLVNYMANKKVDKNENSIKEINTKLENMNSGGNNNSSDIPPYYLEHLETKIKQARKNIMECGMDGETFVFITDIHWDSNKKHSPSLLKKIFNELNINTILCSGDLINEGTKENMSKMMNECVRQFTFENKFFPVAFGNHDSNANNQVGQTDKVFSRNDVYALMYKQNDGKINFLTENDFTFYFDNSSSKTRYIFLDTRGETYPPTISSEGYRAIESCMNSVEEGWHIIFVGHWLVTPNVSDGTLIKFQCGVDIEKFIDGYNTRNVNVQTPNGTYNFSTGKGKVELMLLGHSHIDFNWTTTGGTQVIMTDSDDGIRSANTEYPYVKETITEQAFDIVTINYKTKNIKCVRIGRGADRVFNY
jgi:predicted phosphodiesterase|nr:MAG TPA: Baseplate component [Caudoviricetes sp.]